MAKVDEDSEGLEAGLSAPVPLTGDHDLLTFDCGQPELNDWLRHRALKNESRFARTYVVRHGEEVVARRGRSSGSEGEFVLKPRSAKSSPVLGVPVHQGFGEGDSGLSSLSNG